MKLALTIIMLFMTGSLAAQHEQGDRLIASAEWASAQGDERSGSEPPAGAFGPVVRMDIPAATDQPWDIGLVVPSSEPVAVGDICLLTIWARCVDSMTSEGTFEVHAEQLGGGWRKLASARMQVPGEWTRFDLPFRAEAGFDAGSWQISLHLGYKRQVLEFVGGQVTRFPDRESVEGLPRTELTYRGRDADADWRADAFDRIQKLRVSPMRVLIVDQHGEPVPGVRVEPVMDRSAFSWGSAVAARMFVDESPDGKRYRAELARLFEEMTFENAMKWDHHGLGAPEHIDAGLAFAEANDIAVRGHVMVWPSWNQSPRELRRYQADPAGLREAIAQRIRSTGEQYRGRVIDWDVVNELYTNHDFVDILGDGIVAEWFALADSADPDAALYINDYAILTAGEPWTRHQQSYLDVIRSLVDAGAPIDGIGMQGHFAASLTSPERMHEILDTFAATGLAIKITELDIEVQDPELQADYFRDVLITAYAHRAVEGVIVWGFWAARHWKPGAAWFGRDWERTPQVDVWERLVLDEWRTVEPGQTDSAGAAEFAAHHGSYTVSVEGATAVVDHTPGGSEVRIAISR